MDIFEVLGLIGELEWGKFPDIQSIEQHPELATVAPVVVWRFKEPRIAISQRLHNIVESFHGTVAWILDTSHHRNWIIRPREILTRTDAALYAEKSPEFGRRANAELPVLAEHIFKEYFQESEVTE